MESAVVKIRISIPSARTKQDVVLCLYQDLATMTLLYLLALYHLDDHVSS
jgi:hypothetical protein